MKFMRALVVLGLPIAALGAPAAALAQNVGTIPDVVCELWLESEKRLLMTDVMEVEYEYRDAASQYYDRLNAMIPVRWRFQNALKKAKPELGNDLRVKCLMFEGRTQTAAEYVRGRKSNPAYERFEWDGRIPVERAPATVVKKPEPTKPVPAAKPRSAPPAKSSSPPGTIVYGFADPDEESKTSAQRADEAAERERTRSLNAEQIRRAKEAKLAEEQRRASIAAERQAAHRAQIERQDAEYRAKLAAHNAEVARVRAEWEAQAARCRSGDKQACKGIASQQ